jgi:hypothetical protein
MAGDWPRHASETHDDGLGLRQGGHSQSRAQHLGLGGTKYQLLAHALEGGTKIITVIVQAPPATGATMLKKAR